MAAPSEAFAPRRAGWAGALIGIGVMAAIDEIVFHQILAWHHFFDRATPAIGLLSDGLLHSAELIALVGGYFMLTDLVRRGVLVPIFAWAGLLMGAGGFQLFDGIVDHKVLKLHQIRYVDPLWPYDVAWNAFALLLLAVGAVMAHRARKARADTRDAAASE